jgi:hypothetical protein
VYFVGFCWKVAGAPWVEGSALSYIYHLDELQRFPVPSWFLNPTILKLATWFTLVLEFALGVLIWIKEIRYYLLAIGLFFHLCLEYSLNVPMFQWDVLSAYVLFIDAGDLERVWSRIRDRVGRYFGERVTVIYDGSAERLRRVANLLRAIDIFGRLSFVDSRDSGAKGAARVKAARSELVVETSSGARHGSDATRTVASVVPLLWPVYVGLGIQKLFKPAASMKAS